MTRVISTGPRAGRIRRVAGTRRRRWGIAISVLLHLLALLAVLLLTRRPQQPGEQMAPSYELMFDGGASTPSASPDRGDSTPPAQEQTESSDQPPVPPGASAPRPAAPPDPAPTQQPPQPLAESPPPPPDTASTPPEPAPPAAIPLPEVPPDLSNAEVRTTPPEPLTAPPPMVPDLVLPPPPPLPAPKPPLPRPPAPRPPAPRARTAPPEGTFANPMDLSFNRSPSRDRQAAPRMGAAPGSTASRSMDFSLGAPKAGPNRSEAFFDARARNLGADWMQGVQAFWIRHRYYPRQAAENGEDGDVDLELTVDRTGHVMAATVTSRSGSPWIDMAAVSTFRGAQLPPLPEEVTAPYKTTITIHYLLIR